MENLNVGIALVSKEITQAIMYLNEGVLKLIKRQI